MARTFGGVSTDAVTTNLTSYSTQRSYAVWVARTGDGGGTFGRLFTRSAAETESILNDPVNTYRYSHAFSTTAGAWTIPRPTLTDWHHVLVVYDAGATTNVPTIYLDGSSQTVTTMTTPVGTATSASDSYVIGNSGAGTRNWAGSIAEFAVWDTLLTQADATALYNGPYGTAVKIEEASLKCYYPLAFGASPEPDAAGKVGTATVTGTVLVAHPIRIDKPPVLSTNFVYMRKRESKVTL